MEGGAKGRRMKRLPLATAAAMAVALGGCSGLDVGSLLGVDASQQELSAVKNPPLSVPPDYDLRPPHGGGSRAAASQATRRGRQMITGLTAGSLVLKKRSAGEAALLRLAGMRAGIDSGIRDDVDRETENRNEAEEQFVDKLLKWKEDGGPDGAKKDDGLLPKLGGDDKPVIKRRGQIF